MDVTEVDLNHSARSLKNQREEASHSGNSPSSPSSPRRDGDALSNVGTPVKGNTQRPYFAKRRKPTNLRGSCGNAESPERGAKKWSKGMHAMELARRKRMRIEEKLALPFDCDDDHFEIDDDRPRYSRNDRLDIPDYLFEDEVGNPWDKGDGSGLVMWTDAVFWDRAKGPFEERTADAMDVDPDTQAELISSGPSDLLDALREGIGGRIWGHSGGELKTSVTFKEVIENCTVSVGRCGIGFANRKVTRSKGRGNVRQGEKVERPRFQIRQTARKLQFVPARRHSS